MKINEKKQYLQIYRSRITRLYEEIKICIKIYQQLKNLFEIEMRLLEEEGNGVVDKGEVHQRMMVIVWLVASNLGLWFQAFKQYQWANYFHLYAMAIVTIITWMSGFLAIMEYGVSANFHMGLGVTILILLILQCLGGIVSRSFQAIAKTAPMKVAWANLLHRVFGWILMILVMIQLLAVTRQEDPNIFTVVLVIDLVSYTSFILLKVFRRRMQGYPQIQSEDIQSAPLIKNMNQLAKYHGNYFIFADKIYNLGGVITNHPGGYELINSVRGREVDRFIYGSEAVESVEKMRVHSHSAASIAMAGPPIGFLASTCPFNNMDEINDVTLERCVLPCKSQQIYAPYLVSKSESFVYKGYEEVRQIGKYYAVTILGKKTRLYTLVNFLHTSNLKLMSRIIGKNFSPKNEAQTTLNQSLSTEMISPEKQTTPNSIPLLIKKYQFGQFTQTFLSDNFSGEIKISKPRGKGMSLDEMPNGRIVMFAGGTGIHPYCDLIDLLYKETLVQQNQPLSNEIIGLNPLVKQRTLTERWKFCLYVAVHDTDDIHELTVFQLNHLSKSKTMEVFLRASHRPADFSKSYPDIAIIDKRFDHYVPELAQQLDKISQIYMCGPPPMTAALYKCFGQANIPALKFKTL